jgi:hypothetical protein
VAQPQIIRWARIRDAGRARESALYLGVCSLVKVGNGNGSLGVPGVIYCNIDSRHILRWWEVVPRAKAKHTEKQFETNEKAQKKPSESALLTDLARFGS